MLKLFLFDLKMMVRNKQALFWSFMFPLMFTVIFGFFFGRTDNVAGTIDLVNNSSTEIAKSYAIALKESKLFDVKEGDDIDAAKNKLKKNDISAIVEIPETFGDQAAKAIKNLTVYTDPGNSQANAVLNGFNDKFLTNLNYKVQNSRPIFGIKQESVSNIGKLSYFDFVLAGILGLALMNSSIIGIAVGMTKYREDKILKRITTTPVKTWKFIVAEVLSRLVLNLFQITLILLVGVYGFNGHIYGNLPILLMFSLMGGILFQLIGFAIASFSKTTQAAEGAATAITIPMMFLAGVFFPIDALPKWLLSIVQYLPLAPLLKIIRSVALEATSPLENPVNLIIVLSWIIAALTVSIFRFRLSEE